MSPYWWLLLVSSLYRCVLCSVSCGEGKFMVSEESGEVLLRVDIAEVAEISWIFRDTLIAITKPHESVQIKARHFTDRLYNGTNGSLKITKLTKDDQGLFVANVRALQEEHDCNDYYNLTVYSKLSDDNIEIQHNITPSGICNVSLTCITDKTDVSIIWNNSVTGTVKTTSTVQVTGAYTNTSWTCIASHPVSSISRTVIPLGFCQNENEREIITVAICIGFSLLAVLAIICYLLKKQNIWMKWNRKDRLTSTSDNFQQGDNIYWEIDESKGMCSKRETVARTGNPKGESVYMKVIQLPEKSAYQRSDLLQGDDNADIYLD